MERRCKNIIPAGAAYKSPAIDDDVFLQDRDATLADLPIGREVRFSDGPNECHEGFVDNHHEKNANGLTV